MNLGIEQMQEFEELTKPIMEFISINCHPHVTVIIDGNYAMLVEGVLGVPRSKKHEMCEKWKTCEDRYNGCGGDVSSDLCVL